MRPLYYLLIIWKDDKKYIIEKVIILTMFEANEIFIYIEK